MATDPIVSAQRRRAMDISWARTPNRSERTAPGRAASPNSLEYWINKIRAEGRVREQDVLAAAQSAHRARMTELSVLAAKARARKKAERFQRAV